MTNANGRRIATLQLLRELEDLRLAQAAQRHQQKQTEARALRDEISALEARIDQEIETADAGAAPYLPMFVRTAQKIAADRRAAETRLASDAKRAETEFLTLYQRVTSLRLAEDSVAADQAAQQSRIQRVRGLESMIARHTEGARGRR